MDGCLHQNPSPSPSPSPSLIYPSPTCIGKGEELKEAAAITQLTPSPFTVGVIPTQLSLRRSTTPNEESRSTITHHDINTATAHPHNESPSSDRERERHGSPSTCMLLSVSLVPIVPVPSRHSDSTSARAIAIEKRSTRTRTRKRVLYIIYNIQRMGCTECSSCVQHGEQPWFQQVALCRPARSLVDATAPLGRGRACS
jgi:hypothetical protein